MARSGSQIYWKTVLVDSGIILCTEGDRHLLSKEQPIVVRQLEKRLKRHDAYPSSVQEFLRGFTQYLTDEDNLRQAVLPTNHKTLGGARQDSLIRLLLQVSCLQTELVDKILDEITNRAIEEVTDASLIRLMLSSLRFLPFACDPTKLTTKLLDIIEVATDPVQHEILNLVPEIIPDCSQDKAAEQLSSLLDNRPHFVGAIINCLNGLELSPDVRSKVRDYIMNNFLNSANAAVFPILFEFLVGDQDARLVAELLPKVRHTVDNILSSERTNSETESHKLTACKCLFDLSRNIVDAWIRVIDGVHNFEDHKPIDLLILIMLHTQTNRKTVIESIFKKRVKMGLFKPQLLDELFKHYLGPQILKDHLDSFIYISNSLLTHRHNSLLFDFSSLLYKMLFFHPSADYCQRQDILNNLLQSLDMTDNKNVTPILNIFISLLEHQEKLKPHTFQLMALLEHFETFALHDVKLMFDLLCSLTCSDPGSTDQSGPKDEIRMLINKKLAVHYTPLKSRAIVAAIMMVKHIISTGDSQHADVSHDNVMEISNLPAGSPREAATLLELVHKSTQHSHNLIRLVYDELASMLLITENLDPHFMMWINDTFTYRFESTFVTEATSGKIDDITITDQYSLNTSEEQSDPIAINITELCKKAKTLENDVIITLAPFLRLLRLIRFRVDEGDLEQIGALLGCAVMMPNTDDLDEYSFEQIRLITDCLFHCINWFRENISAFVSQKNKKVRNKVMQRIDDLITLEDLLDKCLEQVPYQNLPKSYFDLHAQGKRVFSTKPKEQLPSKGKKRQRIEDANETTASTSGTARRVTQAGKAKTKSKVEVPKNFRELDAGIMTLLKYPLSLNDQQASQIAGTQTPTLTPKQYNFILNDLIEVLKHVTKSKQEGLSHINLIVPESLIRSFANVMRHINKNFLATATTIKCTLETTDGCEDLPLIFTDEMHHVKMTFDTCLKFYYEMFSWSGFQQTKHRDLLRECLRSFDTEQSGEVFIKRTVTEVSKMLESEVNKCLYISSGVYLVHTLEALYLITMDDHIKKKIHSSSKYMLTKVWYNSFGHESSGKDMNAHLDHLLKAYMGTIGIEDLCNFIDTVKEQVTELKSKDDRLPVLKSVNKANFPLLHRNVCHRLHDAIRIEISSLTNRQHLTLWQNVTFSLKCLMIISRTHEAKSNLVNYLKKSIAILKIFLSDGLPIMEILLKTKPDEVLQVLKTMQASTRFLHSLCCTSRFAKDPSIATCIPAFKQTIESIVQRVKVALVANNCSDAFWLGALKNKDVQGDDVYSQATSESSVTDKNEQDSDEELPPDDESDEELVPQSSASDNSEVY